MAVGRDGIISRTGPPGKFKSAFKCSKGNGCNCLVKQHESSARVMAFIHRCITAELRTQQFSQ